MFALKNFTVRPTGWAEFIWGGGHTAETDPTRQGWRVRPLGEGSSTVLVGRKGIEGCFSARMVGKEVDVAVYLETPEHVAREFAAGRVVDARYVQVPSSSGWGLTAIEELNKEL